jgi:protein gp37
VRFVSAEPLLGPLTTLDLTGVAWLITGGESGGSRLRALVEPTANGWQVKAEALTWVRELQNRCLTADVAFFHKQWGGPRPTSGGRLLDGRTWSEYPDYRSRTVPPQRRAGKG